MTWAIPADAVPDDEGVQIEVLLSTRRQLAFFSTNFRY